MTTETMSPLGERIATELQREHGADALDRAALVEGRLTAVGLIDTLLRDSQPAIDDLREHFGCRILAGEARGRPDGIATSFRVIEEDARGDTLAEGRLSFHCHVDDDAAVTFTVTTSGLGS